MCICVCVCDSSNNKNLNTFVYDLFNIWYNQDIENFFDWVVLLLGITLH